MSVQMMKDPNEWPRWPRLPLVRKGDGACGFLEETSMNQPIEPVVHLGNIFGSTGEEAEELVRYDTFTALARDWRID